MIHKIHKHIRKMASAVDYMEGHIPALSGIGGRHSEILAPPSWSGRQHRGIDHDNMTNLPEQRIPTSLPCEQLWLRADVGQS